MSRPGNPAPRIAGDCCSASRSDAVAQRPGARNRPARSRRLLKRRADPASRARSWTGCRSPNGCKATGSVGVVERVASGRREDKAAIPCGRAKRFGSAATLATSRTTADPPVSAWLLTRRCSRRVRGFYDSERPGPAIRSWPKQSCDDLRAGESGCRRDALSGASPSVWGLVDVGRPSVPLLEAHVRLLKYSLLLCLQL